MPRTPLPPAAVAISFIDRINRGDCAGLGELMTDDHALVVFDEQPLVGRAANIDAWRGYTDACPDYVIHPERIAVVDDAVAVLGRTTGSHLGLPDDVEARETLIWLVTVVDGLVREWRLVPDGEAVRARVGLDG